MSDALVLVFEKMHMLEHEMLNNIFVHYLLDDLTFGSMFLYGIR